MTAVTPRHISGDGLQRFRVLERLIESGELVSSRYSVVVPLLASPLYVIGDWLGEARSWVGHFNALVFGIFLVLATRELRSELSPRVTRAFLLVLLFGSMFPHHLGAFYGEVLSACAVTLGVLWLARGAYKVGWAAIVVGVVNTPAALVGALVIAGRVVLRDRRYGHLVGPLLAFALIRVEGWIVRGSPFASGYETDAGLKTAMPYSGLPGFSYPIVFGVLALLLSFGKGLLFFAPGLFAGTDPRASERVRWVVGTLIGFVAGLIAVYAGWWAWYGGWFWGPRFLLIASVPAALVLATRIEAGPEPPALRELAILAALIFSFWVGASGLVFGQTGLELCRRDDYALEALCHFTPELSPLFHPFVAPEAVVPDRFRVLAFGACAVWVSVALWVGRDLLFRGFRAVRERLGRLARELPRAGG